MDAQSHGKNSQYRCSAFTLVELLVVISIIALLLSVLLPALGKARENARSAVCRSQLKQLGMAVTLYAENNNGYYISNQWAGSGTPSDPNLLWFVRLAPYVASGTKSKNHHASRIFRCPSGQAVKDYGDSLEFSWTAVDYGLQATWAQLGDAATPPRADKLCNIARLSEFATMMDYWMGDLPYLRSDDYPRFQLFSCGSVTKTKWNKFVIQIPANAVPWNKYRNKVFRHSRGGVNAVYLDGHCSNVTPPDWESLSSPSSTR